MNYRYEFRAWDPIELEMHEIYAISNGHACHPSSGEEKYDWILMQYSGLDTDGGKEIYEGDILQYSEPSDGEYSAPISGYYIVRWHESDLRLDLYDPFSGEWWPLADTAFDYVAGNIYENRELIPKEYTPDEYR